MDSSIVSGKVCTVTGASSGIGKATAMGLAQMGATVVMICRTRERGERAQTEIVSRTGNLNVELLLADLSSQRAIRAVAEELKRKHSRLDVLVNNAGGIFSPRSLSEDGIEYTFAVNHLAYFLLTRLLLDRLKESGPSRIVNVSSDAHTTGHINFDDLEGKRRYFAQRAYSQSKLANLLFTYELSRRLQGGAVTVNAVHPGAVRTNFGSTASTPFRIIVKVAGPFMRSPEKGAETVIYLASSKDVEGITGKYFYDKKEARSTTESHDLNVARRLWEVSEQMTRIQSSA